MIDSRELYQWDIGILSKAYPSNRKGQDYGDMKLRQNMRTATYALIALIRGSLLVL